MFVLFPRILWCNQYVCYFETIFAQNIWNTFNSKKTSAFPYFNNIFAYISLSKYIPIAIQTLRTFFFFRGLRILLEKKILAMQSEPKKKTSSEKKIRSKRYASAEINMQINKRKKMERDKKSRRVRNKKVMCFNRVNIYLSIKFMDAMCWRKECSCCCRCFWSHWKSHCVVFTASLSSPLTRSPLFSFSQVCY